MSKRAEERASIAAYGWQSDKEGNMTLEMFPEPFRRGFVKGYEQAEKDLALTWEDIQTIDNIVVDMARNTDWPLRGQEVFYTEVLNRFNKSKEKK